MPTLLHVTNGESAGNTLRQTGLGGAVMSWQDVLHEGPRAGRRTPEAAAQRAAFLSECGWGSRREILSSLERRDGQFVDALGAGAQVVLWFEHDLYDQLQLIDALALAHANGATPELIVVDSSLGTLPADELASLWPSRRTATAEALEHAASAWDAFRAPEPQALADLARNDSRALPFLGPALRRMLEELPAPRDGLSGTERRALQAIRPAPRRRSQPSSPRRSSRTRSFSATRGSSERSQASGRSWRRPKARRCRRRRR